MHVFLTLLALALFILGVDDDKTGMVYAQPGSEAQVRLEVETAPGLVINRKNPPLVNLSDPFHQDASLTAAVLTAAVEGEPWPDDPETYFAHLDPVSWTVSVPQTAAPGVYPLMIEADFSLCDSGIGVCFTEHREVAVTLHVGAVGAVGKGRAATMVLTTPDF